MSSNRPVLERLTTGSATFDRILGGGVPARSVSLVAGQPGAGKTLFALQMLFALARQGKKGLYFTTLSEPSLKLLRYMQQFSFFDAGLLESGGVTFADLGSAIRRQNADATLNEITARVEREQPAVVIIDSFKAFRDILGDAAALRTFVYDLAVHTAGWGATTLLVGEYTEAEVTTNAEFAIADGIIRFINTRHELTAVREVEVLKLRGAGYLTGGHFFEITADGLEFFPRVRSVDVSDAEPAEVGASSIAERASTGVAGLDVMLGGGLPRASTSIVLGGTGTGKTLLGLQFLLEGAARGEAGVLFTLEETPGQLRGFAQSLGWDLHGFEQNGLLTIVYQSPVELSTDCFLDRARKCVQSLGARRAVLDSLTSMALGVVSDRRFKELVYAIAKHFRALGITLNLNLEVGDLLGAAQLSGHGVSFAADNVIQLKYVELEGRLERGVSVLKARGVRHTTDVRRLTVERDGVRIGSPFEGLRGVLTGLPVPSSAP